MCLRLVLPFSIIARVWVPLVSFEVSTALPSTVFPSIFTFNESLGFDGAITSVPLTLVVLPGGKSEVVMTVVPPPSGGGGAGVGSGGGLGETALCTSTVTTAESPTFLAASFA